LKKLLLIGSGAWGQKYIKTITSNFPQVVLTVANRENWKQLIDAHPDGVIVATPPESHVEIAAYSLSQNIPTVIEKPLSLSLNEAMLLEKFNAPVLVNHIHLFSDSYQKIKSIINPSDITGIKTIGYNNSPTRNYSALWDYGPHDLSMILDLTDCLPIKVNITEFPSRTDKSLFDITMDFGRFLTQSIVGNGAYTKKRYISVSFDGLNISYDENSNNQPFNYKPPLENMLNVFIDIINGKKDNRMGLDMSYKILKILSTNK
jgi:predicted dehydrogenase